MQRRFQQLKPSGDGRQTTVLWKLFVRIRAVRLRDEYNERREYLIPSVFLVLPCVFLLFLIYWFPIHLYNIMNGPFPMNLNQFNNHLINFNGEAHDGNFLQIHLWPFQQEYFQIELGTDQIEQESAHMLRKSVSYPNFESSYIMKAVQNDEIYQALYPNRLYIKLPTRGQNHFHNRLPYRFQLFTIKTLRCIVRQLDVSPTTYMGWYDKATFIEEIEEIYSRNSTAFNKKVITACGILIGYLFRPEGLDVYMSGWTLPHLFNDLDIALDTASSYFPYKTYLCFGLLFICILIKFLSNWMIYLYQMYWVQVLVVSCPVEDQLCRFERGTLHTLDEAIVHTPTERSYMNRMFLVQDQYLIIFRVDLNECDPDILRRYYNCSPFIVIPVEAIDIVCSRGITVSDQLSENLIPLPYLYHSSGDSVCSWLHNILMDISERYQDCYRKEELRKAEEARQHRLAELTNEEQQRQRVDRINDIIQGTSGMVPASPQLIAEFRMTPPQTVTSGDEHLLKESCAVCQYNFETGQDYAEWPCGKRHFFHYTCMLNILRNSHTCPLCRNAVEATDIADTEISALWERRFSPNFAFPFNFREWE